LSKTLYKPHNIIFNRIPDYRISNPPLRVGFTEAHMVEKCSLKQLDKTLTVVLE